MILLNRFKFFALLISTLSLIVFISLSRWDKNYVPHILTGDAADYYAYLPAIFIHKDLSFESYRSFEQVDKRYQFRPRYTDDGKKINKFTMGVAAFEMPFFLIAYFTAPDKDFYLSEHYQFFIALSGLFYALIGILLLWHTLIRFVSNISASITCLILFFSTNLYFQIFYDPGFGHVYTFFTLSTSCFLMFKTRYKISDFYITSFLIGLLVFIRPINFWFIIVILYPFIKFGMPFWKEYYRARVVIFSVILAILPMIPQFMYYFSITGQLLYDTYPDEHFYFLDPKYLKGLFSFRNGLLIYTPVYVLTLPGLYFLFKKEKELFKIVSSSFMLHLYLLVAWWAWWWCCGYSLRPMVDILPLLAFSFALLIEQCWNNRYILTTTLLFIIAVSYLNIFQSHQHLQGYLHRDGMTFDIYKKIFLKSNMSNEEVDEIESMLLRPDYRLNPQGIGR